MRHRILKVVARRKGKKLIISSVGRTPAGMSFEIAQEAIDLEGRSKASLKTAQEQAVTKLLPQAPTTS